MITTSARRARIRPYDTRRERGKRPGPARKGLRRRSRSVRPMWDPASQARLDCMLTTDRDTRSTSWWRRMLGPVQTPPRRFPALRYAGPADADALQRLADLDSKRPPRGVVLLAEVNGEPWAA